jgi:hypothetical protein
MKPMPEADKNRRLGQIENDKAVEPPAETARKRHLKKARDDEASAYATAWRDSNLHAPD